MVSFILFLGLLLGQFLVSGSVGMAGDVSEVVVENGLLKTIESTSVSARVAGTISSLAIREGSVVKAEEDVGQVQDVAIRRQLAKAKTALDIAKKKHLNDIDQRLATKSQAVTENEYQRAVVANRQVPDTYPANEIDRLQLVAERAKLEVERAMYLRELAALEVAQAQNEVVQVEELLERHHLVSPVTGVVVAIEKRMGEWVEPGTSVFTVVRVDRLRVEGFIPAKAAHLGLVGKPSMVRFEEGGKLHEVNGEVVFVSPEANPVNAQVRVFLEIENPHGKWRPGTRVQAVIQEL